MRTLTFFLAFLAAALNPAAAGTISVPTPDCPVTFEASPSGEILRAPDFSLTASPGDPALPFKDIYLVLPPNVDRHSVTVTLNDSTDAILVGDHVIAPAPPVATFIDGKEITDWGEGKQIQDGKNALVYGRDELYPSAGVQVGDIGDMRKWCIARVRYYPFRYNPVTHQLRLSAGGEIVVTYSLMTVLSSQTVSPAKLADSLFSDKVAQLASNYSEARSWYGSSAGPVSIFGEPTPGAVTNYVILTTSAIASASTKLQAFVNHKNSRGFSAAVVTESQWGGGTGDTASNRVRAWLKANYVAKGIKYVLLIGNPNPATGDVPMKMLWPRFTSTIYREAPSDYFYADLTGNWDLDGDGNFGESDKDFGPGGIDRYPEVIVGRIPYYGIPADLDSILQKTMDYESGTIGGAWVKNVLLTMKPSDANTPGYQLGEAIKKDAVVPAGFTSTRVYEQTYGLSPAPDVTPCTYDNVTAAWQRHAGFIFWWTHGNETLAADIISTDRIKNLDDRYPLFTFQCSCLNATPENTGNLAYSLLKRGAIATNAATRVSWYYPGQVDYTNTDSNAGMTYKYAIKLMRDHLPCGDAHFAMMVEVPNDIWMNHVVFTIYGDPSVSYAAGPVVIHVPHGDSDSTTAPYVLDAQVTANGPIKAGNPCIKWNTNGGASFSTVPMTLVSGSNYRGQIPAQPYGTTVYYYIYAEDTSGRNGVSPSTAPGTTYSFKIRLDNQPPTVQHTPLANTGDLTGPYTVRATIVDDIGVGSAKVFWHRNGSPDAYVSMLPVGGDVYEGNIPGPSSAGDVIGYYILATDSSLNANTTRNPAAGYYSFATPPRRRIAIYNCSTVPPYFMGSNSNAYQAVADILNADTAQRFQVSIVTSLTSAILANQDALILPDNAVASAELSSVSTWFTQSKTILTLRSGTCYMAASGLFWPGSGNSNGYGTYWDTTASQNDQEICLQDPITSGYTQGQIIDSRGYTAAYLISALPSDAKVLSRSHYDPTRAYAVYRDVPAHGRFVAFGPFIPLQPSQYSLLREALAVSAADRSIKITGPAVGSIFDVGQVARITFSVTGGWLASDKIKLEYSTGLDSFWYPVAGAQALTYSAGSFNWSTAGLPGSHSYKVRATLVGGSLSATSASPFTIVSVVSIAEAKSIPDGRLVKLGSKVVTSDLNGMCYVQEPGRLCGIRVRTAQTISISALATVIGTMNTVDGERTIDAESALLTGVSSQVSPFAVKTSSLGGGQFGAQQPVMEYRKVKDHGQWATVLQPVPGLNNVGLFLKAFGTVTYVGSDYFYINDGANCNDGSGQVGVRVLCSSFTKPSLGAKVEVSGVSSTYYDRGSIWRALILPSQSCLQIIQ